MPYLLKSATVVTFDPPSAEGADLRIAGGWIVERSPHLEPLPGEEVLELNGKLIMPGMVCAHTHLYSALARGMPAPPRAPANFKEILELIWWRLDRALDEETIYWSAIAGAVDAARAGTTCLFDHHASPSQIRGSLQIVREAIEKVGLRAVLCYEVTDRGGVEERDHGLEENRAFLEWTRQSGSGDDRASQRFRAMVGAHASFTLSDESLERCAELMREFNAGLHIHVAEDTCDVEDARSRYDSGIVERLSKHDALNTGTILAHGIHLSDREIELAKSNGVWFAHNPRSNANNQVGYAPVAKFGKRLALGTDGIGADMFEEARFAYFKSRDSRSEFTAGDWLQVLANNQRLASEVFGARFGSLDAGCPADLLVLDYRAPTPLTSENLAWHLAFAMSSASVESVMANGRFIINNRLPAFDAENLGEQARAASEKLWKRLQTL
jgi:putative selenium metabolism protein SsnA